MFTKREPVQYINDGGPVSYLDDSGLERGIRLSAKAKAILILCLVLAAVLAAISAYLSFGCVNTALYKTSPSEYLERSIDLSLPDIKSLIKLDDEDIFDTLEDKGYTLYVNSHDSKSFSVTRIPEDLSPEDTEGLYEAGISSLDASDATLCLYGSWTLNMSKEDNTTMVVRYVDFKSGSIDAAIEAAAESQGFDTSTVEEDGSGVDDYGNTFLTGTVKISKKNRTWRISALPVKEYYDISGLPDDAVYLSIRITL